MSIKTAITRLGALASYYIGIGTYDQDKLGLGPNFGQFNGGTPEAKFAGPLPIVLGRPFEAATSIVVSFPRPYRWGNTTTVRKNWVFLPENSAAAATRRVVAYEHDLITNVFTWKGFVTLTFPTATAHAVRGFAVDMRKETTGTVSASGTAVTGVGTSWLTNKCCVGNRIGFGSTDPTLIATWYEINAMASDTGITLTTTAGTVTAGTPFVIEDLRLVVGTTNATTTNGGLFVVKGLRYENFSGAGTTIPAATTVDSIRAVYWLKDAAVITNLVMAGLSLDADTSPTSQFCWVTDGTTTCTVFKHNIRAALTLTAGADTSNFAFKTATSATLTGTGSQNDNLVSATTAHGPGSGLDCLYFATTTRFYRTKAKSTITAGDTTFLTAGDQMTEVPPGGALTYTAGAVLNSSTYLAPIDNFVLLGTHANATRSYVTQYRTDAGQLNRIFGCDLKQQNQSSSSADITTLLSTISTPMVVGGDNLGTVYFVVLNLATSNSIFGLSFAADWEYAGPANQRLILPRMATPSASKLSQAFVNAVSVLGGRTGQNLGSGAEPYRTYYRTSGITDNSGAWTLMDDTLNMSGAAASTHVQLMCEFRTIGWTCVPARILGAGVVFEDIDTDSHFEFSHGETVPASRIFAWRHSVAFGAVVPPLKIQLYDATDAEAVTLLVTDTTSTSASGTWERSTDGTAWSAWSNTDKTNDTTYVRYTLTSLAGNPAVRCILSSV